MKRRILSVGQCRPDHSSLVRLFKTLFPEVEIEEADVAKSALEKAQNTKYDLILINRKLDADYSDGLEIIRHLKSDEKTSQTPTMLVTNYAEYHQEAVALGALPGFGKAQLNDPKTHELLQAILA